MWDEDGPSRNLDLASFLVGDTAMLLETGLERGWLQTIVSDQTIFWFGES